MRIFSAPTPIIRFVWTFSCFLCSEAFVLTTTKNARPQQPIPDVATVTDITTTALQAKGFGAKATVKKPLKKTKNTSTTFTLDRGSSIQNYLHPRLFEDDTLKDIGQRLRNQDIVVIRNAFREDFAEAMHQELEATDMWSRNEGYQTDGYHYRHYNIYDKDDFSDLFLQANEVFDSPETKEFMTKLTGRDCTGENPVGGGAPSYYGSGDHSLPHTDHIGQRSVAYIWHLCSKKWKPEWGGGLYWAPEPLANAYLHASFNTLVVMTPHSSHFVTTVSPHATEKRLAYNGWWHCDWLPSARDDDLEDRLATPEQRMSLTHTQILAIQDMLDDPWAPRIQPAEKEARVRDLRAKIMEELYPEQRSSPIE
eukprot:scaffold4510_cov183-Amphora_coffeaeformis.AAC.116